MLDWIGSLGIMTGLILSGRKNIYCWPVWIVGNFFWIIFGIQSKILSIIVLNFAFIIVNVIGWRNWRKEQDEVSDEQ